MMRLTQKILAQGNNIRSLVTDLKISMFMFLKILNANQREFCFSRLNLLNTIRTPCIPHFVFNILKILHAKARNRAMNLLNLPIIFKYFKIWDLIKLDCIHLIELTQKIIFEIINRYVG